MLAQLTDWTTRDQPTKVQSLQRMNAVLGWGHNAAEFEEAVTELNDYVSKLQPVPIEVRRFLGAVASRIHRVWETRAVENGMNGVSILASDIERSLQLSTRVVANLASELEAYGLGDIDEIQTNLGSRPAIRIRHLPSTWPIWMDIVNFCEKAPESLTAFTDDLDFRRLD